MAITRLPQVDKILRHERLLALQSQFRRDLLVDLVRDELDRLRATAGESGGDMDSIVAAVCRQAQALMRPSLSKVINGTGVVLNTNLGRAPLGARLLAPLPEELSGYCNLEIDLSSGKRGKRSQQIELLLKLLTGAEAALVVNNNAAAVVLCVNALAGGREVVVSRGELIEIGGSFRLPDVIEAAGGILREVGTTNRTRVADFKKAIDARTGLLMRCHRSNFAITGFTEAARLEDLVALSQESGVPLLEDLGSGVIYDLAAAGLGSEPTVAQVVASGCALVSFSGDKLLGGPQCGIIVGKKALVDRLSKHPLYRALRLDKLTLALLERTLSSYLHPEPQHTLPALAMLMESVESISVRAQSLSRTISDTCQRLRCSVIATRAAAGGGSLPEEEMPSAGLRIDLPGVSAARLASLMRGSDPPVIGVVQEDRFILDFRTITGGDQQLLLQILQRLDQRSV